MIILLAKGIPEEDAGATVKKFLLIDVVPVSFPGNQVFEKRLEH